MMSASNSARNRDTTQSVVVVGLWSFSVFFAFVSVVFLILTSNYSSKSVLYWSQPTLLYARDL